MGPTSGASETDLTGTARGRRIATALLLLHWGAVGAYVLPANRDSLEQVPAVVRPVASALLPRMVRATLPVSEPYWNLTATRQAWTLFAPWPADWENAIRVVPYFRTGEAGTWRADTVTVVGGADRPYPHFLRHRSYRILYNLGYASWEGWYRPWFAREMCSTLRDEGGRPPEGVALFALWRPIPVPWRPDDDEEAYPQRLGGFDCAVLEPYEGTPWREYDLPGRLDTRGWPLVRERADSTTTTGDGTAAPPKARP